MLKAHSRNRKGKCEPCNTSKPSLWCKQVIDTSTFPSYQTKQLYTVFYKLNCKSKFIIYLMECAWCKVQYIGKAETAFNVRLNNHKIWAIQNLSRPFCISENLGTDSICMQNLHYSNNQVIFIQQIRTP